MVELNPVFDPGRLDNVVVELVENSEVGERQHIFEQDIADIPLHHRRLDL